MNKESTIEVGGHKYQCGSLPAMQQFHVVRRLGPALVIAGVSVEMLRKGVTLSSEEIVGVAGPVIMAIGQMKDEDADYVIYTCLGVVKRQSGNAWAPVAANDSGAKGRLMFEDIDLVMMLRLVGEVLMVNLGNFLTEPSASPT